MNAINIFKKLFLKKATAPIMIVLLLAVLVIVLYTNKKDITVVIDGQPKNVIAFRGTVEKVLEKENIILGSKDKIDKDLKSKLTDDEIINIRRAVIVNVSVDGKKLNIQSAEKDIDSMIKAEGIVLNAEDKIAPKKETKLSKDMKVEITRVETKTITETEPIEFETVVKKDNDLPNTTKKVVQEGKKGEKKIIKNVIYENGKEVARKLVSETVVNKPVDKVIAQGTQKVVAVSRAQSPKKESVSRGGNDLSYSRVIKAKTTAYCPSDGGGNTRTATGRTTVRNPGGYSTVAVDPSVIAFGTRMYIEGYGHAIAADSGSAVKGNFIDVFFNTHSEACSWGIRHVNVYILK